MGPAKGFTTRKTARDEFGPYPQEVVMTKVAIQGEAGAFSHEAAHQLLGPDVQLVPCRTFSEAFQALSNGEADRAVMPVENALVGPVVETLDLLWASGLTVRGETRVRIRLCLSARPGVAIEDVRTVASHPVALGQCRNLFEKNPRMRPVVVYDTAGSVKDMMGGTGEYDAAVSSRLAAELYGARLLETGVEDDDRNYTRFFELAVPGVAPEAGGVCGAVAVGIPNEPGALYNLLGVFSRYDVDMSQIVARPIRGEPWKYRFYMELVAPDEPALQECLKALDEGSVEMRVFGTYAPYEDPEFD
jgi:prephenate dehydratase